MIEIKKVTDTQLAQKICRDNGIEWKSHYHVIATVENENVLHCAVFCCDNEIGTILVIDGFNGELDLLDGLCRAILNIMDIKGVKEVYLPLKYQKIADLIGFELKNRQYFLHLEGFFSCGCCRSTKKGTE